MGQYWKLVNIDKKREVRNPGGLKLWEFLVNTAGEQLVGLLRQPKWLRFRIPSHRIQASKTGSSSSPLIKLPQEIIDAIVSLLYDTGEDLDLICLSMTCTYFFRLLAKLLQDVFIEDNGPWSGDRLIFVGDYAANYPEGIATAAEEAEWGQLGRNPLYELPTVVSAEGPNAKTPSWIQQPPFEVWGTLLELARERLAGQTQCLQRFDRMSQMLLHVPSRDGDAATGQAILRNLTAKQYVRDEALALSEYAYSLGEVVVVYTQWTEDPSGTEGLGIVGEWAGHRFDINDMSSVDGEEWRDVSDDAIEKLKMATGLPKTDGRRA